MTFVVSLFFATFAFFAVKFLSLFVRGSAALCLYFAYGMVAGTLSLTSKGGAKMTNATVGSRSVLT